MRKNLETRADAECPPPPPPPPASHMFRVLPKFHDWCNNFMARKEGNFFSKKKKTKQKLYVSIEFRVHSLVHWFEYQRLIKWRLNTKGGGNVRDTVDSRSLEPSREMEKGSSVIGSSSYRELGTNDSRLGSRIWQVPCTLHFKGHKKFNDILKKELSGTELELDWHIFCDAKKDRIHGCFKIYSMFSTTVLRSFWLVKCWQTWFELSRVKLYRKWPEGKRKLLRVSGRFELSRVRVTKGKIAVNVWQKSRGNQFWFELARGSS